MARTTSLLLSSLCGKGLLGLAKTGNLVHKYYLLNWKKWPRCERWPD